MARCTGSALGLLKFGRPAKTIAMPIARVATAENQCLRAFNASNIGIAVGLMATLLDTG
jgi:hypothetical protein